MDATTFKIESIEIIQEKLDFLTFNGWKSLALNLATLLAAVVTLTIKVLVIFYVSVFAPRDRPINTLLAIDQVKVETIIFFKSLSECHNQNIRSNSSATCVCLSFCYMCITHAFLKFDW